MAFVEVGNDQGSGNRSPIMKWNSVGQTVEGVYRGQRNGKFGPLTVVQTDSGEMVYGTKAVLGRKLADVSVGDRVRIEYLGKRQSEQGREYGDFRVLVDKAPQKANFSFAPSAEFERLVGLIRKDKGDVIAGALSAAAQMAGDPVTAIRDAMKQIGVLEF